MSESTMHAISRFGLLAFLTAASSAVAASAFFQLPGKSTNCHAKKNMKGGNDREHQPLMLIAS